MMGQHAIPEVVTALNAFVYAITLPQQPYRGCPHFTGEEKESQSRHLPKAIPPWGARAES